MNQRLIVPPGHLSVADAVKEYGPDLPKMLMPNSLSRFEMGIVNRWKDSKFFLVRNRGGETGERYRCSRHEFKPGVDQPVYHEFFTTMCVDRPWRGLEQALWGFALITENERLAARLEYLATNASMTHPRTFQPTDRESAELVAIALGTLEPISQSRAEALAREINARRPPEPFVL